MSYPIGESENIHPQPEEAAKPKRVKPPGSPKVQGAAQPAIDTTSNFLESDAKDKSLAETKATELTELLENKQLVEDLHLRPKQSDADLKRGDIVAVIEEVPDSHILKLCADYDVYSEISEENKNETFQRFLERVIPRLKELEDEPVASAVLKVIQTYCRENQIPQKEAGASVMDTELEAMLGPFEKTAAEETIIKELKSFAKEHFSDATDVSNLALLKVLSEYEETAKFQEVLEKAPEILEQYPGDAKGLEIVRLLLQFHPSDSAAPAEVNPLDEELNAILAGSAPAAPAEVNPLDEELNAILAGSAPAAPAEVNPLDEELNAILAGSAPAAPAEVNPLDEELNAILAGSAPAAPEEVESSINVPLPEDLDAIDADEEYEKKKSEASKQLLEEYKGKDLDALMGLEPPEQAKPYSEMTLGELNDLLKGAITKLQQQLLSSGDMEAVSISVQMMHDAFIASPGKERISSLISKLDPHQENVKDLCGQIEALAHAIIKEEEFSKLALPAHKAKEFSKTQFLFDQEDEIKEEQTEREFTHHVFRKLVSASQSVQTTVDKFETELDRIAAKLTASITFGIGTPLEEIEAESFLPIEHTILPLTSKEQEAVHLLLDELFLDELLAKQMSILSVPFGGDKVTQPKGIAAEPKLAPNEPVKPVTPTQLFATSAPEIVPEVPVGGKKRTQPESVAGEPKLALQETVKPLQASPPKQLLATSFPEIVLEAPKGKVAQQAAPEEVAKAPRLDIATKVSREVGEKAIWNKIKGLPAKVASSIKTAFVAKLRIPQNYLRSEINNLNQIVGKLEKGGLALSSNPKGDRFILQEAPLQETRLKQVVAHLNALTESAIHSKDLQSVQDLTLLLQRLLSSSWGKELSAETLKSLKGAANRLKLTQLDLLIPNIGKKKLVFDEKSQSFTLKSRKKSLFGKVRSVETVKELRKLAAEIKKSQNSDMIQQFSKQWEQIKESRWGVALTKAIPKLDRDLQI